MGCPDELRPDMSVTDLAYRILKVKGSPLNFKELIGEILQIKPMGGEQQGKMIAQIHTEINLDSRFIHQGAGQWGLRDWQPKGGTKVVQFRTTTTQPSRTRAELMAEDGDAGAGPEDGDTAEEDEEEEIGEDGEETLGYEPNDEFEEEEDEDED